MLISALNGFSSNPTITIISILLMIPTLLISLTVHEYSHGRMALALGDKTALMMGRLTLNPIKHIDPWGAIMLLLFGFGYAKPVPINTRNFTKVKYKTGLILVSIAGPLSNFLLAFIGVLLLHVFFTVIYYAGASNSFFTVIYLFLSYFITMNIGLGIFNLIPIPPLDGSRILTVFLPHKLQFWFFKYERYIQIVIFILLFRGVFDAPLNFLRDSIFNIMDSLISLIPFLK